MICLDKPGYADLRIKTRPAHLKWIEDNRLSALFIGPILSDDDETMMGSLFVAEFPDLAAARAFQQSDPYTKAGLFAQAIVQPTRNIAKPE